MNRTDFKGKVVYVTGASAGIGKELTRQLAAEGARLALFARRAELLDDLAAEAKALGGEAKAYTLDVTRREDVKSAMAAAEADLGPCDVLIANAGIGFPITAKRLDAGKFASILDVNVSGALHAIEAVLPGMLARRSGHLVGISSLASYASFPGSWAYCASKAALSSLLEGLRLELRPQGIDVTTICPGFIRTDMTKKNKLPMPFLLDCDVAVKKILRAIRDRRAVYNFPKPMYWTIRAARLLPEALVVKAFSPRRDAQPSA